MPKYWAERLLRAAVFAMFVSVQALGAAEPPPSRPRSGQVDPEGVEGLLTDLERIIQAEQTAGWFLDRAEYREIYPVLLNSVCRASVVARQGALEVVKRDHERTGSAAAQFRASGRLDARAEQALYNERRWLALSRAVRGARADCPFWLVPVRGYHGRQTMLKRWSASLETGGVAQLRLTEGDLTLGAGGGMRIFGGYRSSRLVSWLAGIELGGGALIRPGTSASQFVINYFPAVPLLLRFHNVAWHYEIEAAAVGVFQADNVVPSYGIRMGGGFGFSTLRAGSLLPWAGLAIAAEHYFPGGGRAATQFLRGGLRAGFYWDPE